MSSLLQAAVTGVHSDLGALWQWAAITLLGILLARAERQRTEDRTQLRQERKDAEDDLRQACEKRDAIGAQVVLLQRQVDKLDVLVGVNGNGIIARLDLVVIKLDKVLTEQAELRGATGKHLAEGI